MKQNSKYLFLFVILGVLLFSSCKTGKETKQIAMAKIAKTERIDLLYHQAIQYNTFSSSLRFNFKSKAKNMSADAQLKIIKDKILQLSVQFLGFEIARISITPEQIIVINRANKQYFSESMETLQSQASFDFDFYSLQALFTNHLFVAGKQEFTDDYDSFRITEEEFSVVVNNTDRQGINYDFTSDYTNRILQTEMYKNNQPINMKWFYRDFGLTSNKKLFPMKMNMELTIPDDLVTLNLTFSSVDINNVFELETNIPNKYQRLNINQVLNFLQSK
jgi:hypothetical protein